MLSCCIESLHFYDEVKPVNWLLQSFHFNDKKVGLQRGAGIFQDLIVCSSLFVHRRVIEEPDNLVSYGRNSLTLPHSRGSGVFAFLSVLTRGRLHTLHKRLPVLFAEQQPRPTTQHVLGKKHNLKLTLFPCPGETMCINDGQLDARLLGRQQRAGLSARLPC